ncbi:copper transporter [Nocardioides sp. GXQ0305]|uniref:copper transporter n=1 Tax=Nocardioides sp. GXQ0305 TaxID=3423912 RepID=UPI003D7D0C7E
MTLVRRHLVAAVLLVLALATGIALGAGPLSRETLVPARAEPRQAPQPTEESADELAEAVAPTVTRDQLSGRVFTVVSTPGADEADVEALVEAAEQAGGDITNRWQIGTSLVSASETALVDTLGEQMLEQLGSEVADADAPPYERMGQLLGAAVATRDERAQVVGDDATTIRQSLDAASLLTTSGEQPKTAPLVLVVLGDDVEDAVVEGLTAGLAQRARRVVVTADERPGDLQALEEAGVVSTVDGADGAAGRMAAVLALAAPVEDPPGSYGASGSDGAAPLG